MKHVLLFMLAVCIAGSAMAAKKKRKKVKVTTQTVTQTVVKSINKSNTMRLCTAPDPQPSWFLELPSTFKFPANMQQPSNYRLVSTIDTVFNSYLKNIPYKNSKVNIMLPLLIQNTIECKEFIISRTETMDSALQAKYPNLMSFKAFAADNSLNTARIDCDETSVKMMITFDKKVYFITSVPYNKTNYFVCYAKDDPNFVKDKFEK